MGIDIAAGILVFSTAVVGAWKGLWLSALSVGGVVLAYLSGYLLYRPVGQALHEAFQLQPLAAYPLGAFASFSAVFMLVGIAGLWIKRRRASQRLQGQREPWLSRLGGALFGALSGAALALVLAWSLLLLQAVAPRQVPDVTSSFLGRTVRRLGGKLAYAVTRRSVGNEAIAAVAKRAARNPLEAVRNVDRVLQDRRVTALFADAETMAALSEGDTPAAAGRIPRLGELAKDPDFVDAARRAGLIERVDAEGVAIPVEQQLAATLAPLARVARKLAADPEVRRLLEDPGLLERVQRRDLAALANDPGFNRLAAIIMATLREAPGRGMGANVPDATPRPTEGRPATAGEVPRPDAAPPRLPSPAQEAKPDASLPIYRWRDRHGVVHYSDQEPPRKTRFRVVPK